MAPRNQTDGRPLSVEFAAPRGEAGSDVDIVLIFNKSMRSLDSKAPAAVPVSLSPSLAGHWEWIGSRILHFVPTAWTVPRATEYEVVVPVGTRALDGSEFLRPFVMAFQTPRPRVESVAIENKPNGVITLTIHPETTPDEVQHATHLTLSVSGKTVDIPFKTRDSEQDSGVDLVPLQPLPHDVDVSVAVDGSLHSSEGPRTLGETWHGTVHTYGPLVIHGECPTNNADEAQPTEHPPVNDRSCLWGQVTLEFSSPVSPKDAMRAVSITPYAKINPLDASDTESTQEVVLNAAFIPGKEYTVRVAPWLRGGRGKKSRLLRDTYGEALAKPWSQSFRFRPEPAEEPMSPVRIWASGSIIDTAPPTAVNAYASKLSELGVTTASLTLPEYALLANDDAARASPSIAGAKHWKVPLSPSNKGKARIALDGLFGDLGHERGGAIVALDDNGKPLAQWMAHVTDLGLTTVSTPFDRLAWVTHLSTATPIAGVTVDFMPSSDGHKPSTGQTDAEGFYFDSAAEPRTMPDSVSAQHQDDWTVERSGYERELPGLGKASVFTNQGIYRPGETVRIKGIMRAFTRTGIDIPKQRDVSVSVKPYEGTMQATLSAKLDDFGTFSTSWVIPTSIKLGVHFLEACLTLWQKPICGHAQFRVAEFRPPTFLVDTKAARDRYVRGDTVQCNAQARLLFGMPLRDAPIEWNASSTSAYFRPPIEEFYFWSGGSLDYRERDTHEATGRLDQAGAHVMDHKLSLGVAGDPAVHFTCQAGVTDSSHQQEFDTYTVLVHPAEFYLGIKSASTMEVSYVRPGTPIPIDVIAAEPDGARRAAVDVRLTFRRVTSTGGLGEVLSQCETKTGQTKKICTFIPGQPGNYKVVAEAADPRGNRVRAEMSVGCYVPKPQPAVRQTVSEPSTITPSPRSEVNLDKSAYEVGETAHLELASPFDTSEALVTVVREGILARRRVTLSSSSATLELPIVDAYVPNALVSVHFLKGRTSPPASFDDPGAPAARYFETDLRVSPAGHKLNVKVAPSTKKALPGQNLDVELTVTDASGLPERCQLTVYATDEAVLALTGYSTPDPFGTFLDERRVWLTELDSRQFLLDRASMRGGWHQTLAPKVRMGATTIGNNELSVRQDMRTAVYFNPDLRTNARGQAHVSFRLPESLSSFRVMAVAVAKDRFGSAATSVTTSKALMLRPALPRLLRAGDEAEAAVLVTSSLDHPMNTTVSLVAEGLKLLGEASQTVAVGAGATAEVRFSVRTSGVGRARLRFSGVASSGERDRVELPIDVKAPNVLQTVALYGDTTSVAGERLGNLHGVRPDVGGLSVSLASSALVGLDTDIQSLIEYPYGCTEQLASQLLPLVALTDLARSTGVEPTRNQDEAVKQMLTEITARQRSDGGFSYWPGSARSDPWISIQALTALIEAKSRGFDVPASILEKAARYARALVAKQGSSVKNGALGVYALDVLVQIAKPTTAETSGLHDAFEQRARLPLFARALLLHALATAHEDRAAVATVAREIEQSIRVDGPVAVSIPSNPDFAELLDSNVRTTALVLRALLAYDPRHPLISPLARGLLAARTGPNASFRTTQEAGWALVALNEYRKAREPSHEPFDARVFLGPALLAEARLSGNDLRASKFFIPTSKLGPSSGDVLAFEARGQGMLFYQARLTYSLPALPTEPRENGFIVHRTMRVTDRESASGRDAATTALQQLRETPDAIPVGSLVAVGVTFGTILPRNQVVIDCPVPAGLEITDFEHATSASLGPNAEAPHVVWLGNPGRNSQKDNNWIMPSHSEVRDDRMLFFFDHLDPGLYQAHFLTRATTLGTFIAPPAEVTEMYAPEISGLSRADRVRVVP